MKKFLLLLIFFATVPVFSAEKDKTFMVTGMTCVSCATSIERELKKIPAVDSVDISLRKGTVKVHLKEGKTVEDQEITSAIKKAGFKATPNPN